MKTISRILLSLVVLVATVHAEDKPALECTVGGRAIKVFLADEEFDPSKHKIEYREGAYGPETLFIDGHEPLGTDNQLPKRSWKRFTVLWDGVETPLPGSLYKAYYHPNIDTAAVRHRNLVFTIDPGGEWIQVIMRGSDGGGAYLAGWELRRDGKHKRIDPSQLYQPPS
ncbi:MAG: hypothetical protein V4584_05090 [Verrucomicrobiota bacterium]